MGAAQSACCASTEAISNPPIEAVITAPSKEPQAAATKVEAEEVPAPAEPTPAPSAPAAPAPAKAVTFTFVLPDGTVVEKVFTSKPLGVDFGKETPLKVKRVKPDTPALASGIQPGWIMTKVNGTPLPEDFTTTMNLVKNEVNVLGRDN
eukprot:TRINITY_DN55253_c0_g1_i1.p1 TRINITY_DN55253_c0_g1~~TRINITY_DN55253_c0_g1_i1.p1  ORF type:complete len:149 (+),score=34.78 TRINITY_DN55253_c0_g1_i1:69-515(+)